MSIVQLVRDWVLDPVGFLFLLGIVVILLGGRGVLRRLLGVFWIALVLFMAAPKSVNPMLRHYEQAFSEKPSCLGERPIVVLGGGVDSRAKGSDEFERMSKATLTRVAQALKLADIYRNSPVLVAGGALRTVSEADVMAHFLVRNNVEPRRIISEAQSSSTFENAANIKAVMIENSLDLSVNLVTSALHMRRAMAVFEKAGIQVCPIGVDHVGLESLPFYAWMPQTTALVKFDLLLHEWLGSVLYRVKGYL